MHKLKYLFLVSVTAALPLFAQFMDPERPATKTSTTVIKKDELFPEIIPDHGWGGGGETVVVLSNQVEKIEKETVVLSNTVEKVVEQTVLISNTVEKVVEQQVIISNTIERVEVQVNSISNDVAEVREVKLDNNVESMTNSTEFVQAVQAVTPTSTNVWPKLEFDKVKAENEKFRGAFTSITGMTISTETSIDEIKRNLQIIKDAAVSVLAE